MNYLTFIGIYNNNYSSENGSEDGIDTNLIATLHKMPLKALVKLMGSSRAAASHNYQIPLRTLEDWAAGRRSPDPTVDYLLRFAIYETITANREINKPTVTYKCKRCGQAYTDADLLGYFGQDHSFSGLLMLCPKCRPQEENQEK